MFPLVNSLIHLKWQMYHLRTVIACILYCLWKYLLCFCYSLSLMLEFQHIKQIYLLKQDPLVDILSQCKTRGPWWSYIAHLTKQICIFTVEVSAKFTALGFLYKLYSTNHPHPTPPHPPPCFFTNLDDLNWILKEGHQRNISAKLYWNWSSGLKSFIQL